MLELADNDLEYRTGTGTGTLTVDGLEKSSWCLETGKCGL